MEFAEQIMLDLTNQGYSGIVSRLFRLVSGSQPAIISDSSFSFGLAR